MPLLSAALVLSGGVVVRAQETAPAQAPPKVSKVPKAAEPAMEADKLRREAMVAGDIEKLAELLADGLVYTHSSGKVDNKKTLLESIRSGASDYEKIEPRDMVVRARGAGTVIVTGVVAVGVKTPEGPKAFDARFTAIYGRTKDGKWQLNTWQRPRVFPSRGNNLGQPVASFEDGAGGSPCG